MARFTVTRTSHESTTAPPVAGATREACLRVDQRTSESAAAHDRHMASHPGACPSPWLSEGKNHRVTAGGIARDFDDEAWFLDVPDLDALLALVALEGEIVVWPAGSSRQAAECPSIEVYDDYRE